MAFCKSNSPRRIPRADAEHATPEVETFRPDENAGLLYCEDVNRFQMCKLFRDNIPTIGGGRHETRITAAISQLDFRAHEQRTLI